MARYIMLSIWNYSPTRKRQIAFELPKKMHKAMQNSSQLLFHGRKLSSQWQQQTALQKHLRLQGKAQQHTWLPKDSSSLDVWAC